MEAFLAGLEPQLAIPVILVVVGAVLVYIFGFKQTEEPSYEHLAVLQSSSSYKNRSVTSNNPKQTKTAATANPATAKSKANGHVPTSNGITKVAKVEVNKENKPPKDKANLNQKRENVKDPASKPEDFESGTWIPAVSRKDKNVKKTKKEVVKPEPSSPGKKQKSWEVSESKSNKNDNAADAEAVPEVKARTIEEVLAEMNAQKSNQNTPQSSPEKKGDEKEAAAKPREVVAAKKEEIESAPLPPKVKAAVEEASTFKANIAFDEMGGTSDTWEEAKSRGAKKRRTRKD